MTPPRLASLPLCGCFRLKMRAGGQDRCVLLGFLFLHGGAPVLYGCRGVALVQSRFCNLQRLFLNKRAAGKHFPLFGVFNDGHQS